MSEDSNSAPNAPQPESELTWLFGADFWKWLVGGTLLLSLGIGSWSYFFLSARPDPTELTIVAPSRAVPGQSLRLSFLARDNLFERVVPEVSIRATLASGKQTWNLGEAKTGNDGIAELTTSIDADIPHGDYLILASASAKRRTAKLELPIQIGTNEVSEQPVKTAPDPTPTAGQRIHIQTFPESGKLVRNCENILYIVTSYPDASPAKTNIRTGGASQSITNDLGIGSVRFTPKDAKERLSISARSLETDIEQSVFVEIPMDPRRDGILVRPDYAIYNPGDVLKVTAQAGALKAERIFVDLVQNGRSYASQTIELSDRSGNAEIQLPEGLGNTIELQAHTLLANGNVVGDSRFFLIGEPAAKSSPTNAELMVKFATIDHETKLHTTMSQDSRSRAEDHWQTRRNFIAHATSWLGIAPFVFFAGFALIVISYGRSRTRFVPAGTDDPATNDIRKRLRSLGWLLLISTLLPPLICMPVFRWLLPHFGLVAGTFITLVAVGTIVLSVRVAELRALPHVLRNLSRCNTVIWIVPAIYCLSMLSLLGIQWADQINEAAVSPLLAATHLVLTLGLSALAAAAIHSLGISLTTTDVEPKPRSLLKTGAVFSLLAILASAALIYISPGIGSP